MSELTRITDAQKAILNTYTCQRLTDDPENVRRVWGFFSKRGKSLMHTLQEEAWQEDLDGFPNAYYVIKNPEEEIMMFFSLKCGTLCDPNYAALVFARYDRSKELMDALKGKETTEWAQEYLEKLRSGTGEISRVDRLRIKSKYWDAHDEREDLKMEKNVDPNGRLIRVDEAFPAVELVHFCVNDRMRAKWNAHGLGHGMGEVFFWWFVLPRIREIHRLVGCEYVYLFAADSSDDHSLIRYYEKTLHFRVPSNIGTVKPRYDFLCPFMCRRLFTLSDFRRKRVDPDLCGDLDVKGLVDYCDYFFENFNKKPVR